VAKGTIFGLWRHVSLYYLFNDAVNISDRIAPNDEIISEWGIGIELEESGLALFKVIIPTFAYSDWGRPRNPSGYSVSLPRFETGTCQIHFINVTAWTIFLAMPKPVRSLVSVKLTASILIVYEWALRVALQPSDGWRLSLRNIGAWRLPGHRRENKISRNARGSPVQEHECSFGAAYWNPRATGRSTSAKFLCDFWCFPTLWFLASVLFWIDTLKQGSFWQI
jgi:hypothetical protein